MAGCRYAASYRRRPANHGLGGRSARSTGGPGRSNALPGDGPAQDSWVSWSAGPELVDVHVVPDRGRPAGGDLDAGERGGAPRQRDAGEQPPVDVDVGASGGGV